MSWVQWRGETWETTGSDAELRLFLKPREVHVPLQCWWLSIFQMARPSPATPESYPRMLDISLPDLFFPIADWRHLGGQEIRADAAWHDAHEHTTRYGRLVSSEITALYLPPTESEAPPERWQGHDFTLRLGTRDGFYFPCELDAWLQPEEEYFRRTPEPESSLALFGQGPPTLRVLARAHLCEVSITLPPCGEDPLPLARRLLREQAGLPELHQPEITWVKRQLPGDDTWHRMPGSGSTVRFSTTPAK